MLRVLLVVFSLSLPLGAGAADYASTQVWNGHFNANVYGPSASQAASIALTSTYHGGVTWVTCVMAGYPGTPGSLYALKSVSNACAPFSGLYLTFDSAACTAGDVRSVDWMTCSPPIVTLDGATELTDYPQQYVVMLGTALLMFAFGWLAGK